MTIKNYIPIQKWRSNQLIELKSGPIQQYADAQLYGPQPEAMLQAGKPSSTNNVTRIVVRKVSIWYCGYTAAPNLKHLASVPTTARISILVPPTMNSMTHWYIQPVIRCNKQNRDPSKSSSRGNGYARCMVLEPADAKFCAACIWHPRTGTPDPKTSRHRPQSRQHMLPTKRIVAVRVHAHNLSTIPKHRTTINVHPCTRDGSRRVLSYR